MSRERTFPRVYNVHGANDDVCHTLFLTRELLRANIIVYDFFISFANFIIYKDFFIINIKILFFIQELRNEYVRRWIEHREICFVQIMDCANSSHCTEIRRRRFLLFAKGVPDPALRIQCRNGKRPGSPKAVHENPGNQECSRSNKISKRILS